MEDMEFILEKINKLKDVKKKTKISTNMENDFLFAILLTVVDIYNEIKKDKGLVVDPIKLTKAQLVDILAEKGKDKSEISKLTKEQLIELLG